MDADWSIHANIYDVLTAINAFCYCLHIGEFILIFLISQPCGLIKRSMFMKQTALSVIGELLTILAARNASESRSGEKLLLLMKYIVWQKTW